MTFPEDRLPWRTAMDRALYGPGGFFVTGDGPAAHFRTSVHASPLFATALLRLVERVDAALGHPDRLDVVDIGAGRGELLLALAVLAVSQESAGSAVGHRLRLTAVERAPRPEDLPEEINWVDEIPSGISGLVLATEWLDNVPLDVAVHGEGGWRYLLVDPSTASETVGDLVSLADADWLARWWPIPTVAGTDGTSRTRTDPDAAGTGDTSPAGSGFRAARPAEGSSLTARSRSGCPEPPTTDPQAGPETPHETSERAEIGRTRDEGWAEAVKALDRGLAVAVDYGHTRDERPVDGSLTGYRAGRQVAPVPDGSCDVTAHVAVDAVAAAGSAAAGLPYTLVSQREALRALGADGGRPPLALASTDPAGYVRALAAASTVAELTDPAGLGAHWWLLQPVGVDLDPFMAR